MRQGEILAVKWKHVHLDQRYISLPADITKTNRARSVPLSSGAIELLRSLPRGKNEDRVVESNRPALRSAWIRVVANAGIADMRFHDLRHHATSRLFEKGAHSGEGDR
jgi:integrase